MGENSKIAWCDHTFNPWMGCAKVSPGCDHCYAERMMDTRMGKAKWGDGGTRVRTSEAYWRQQFKWNREAAKSGIRRKVFCASLADVFEDRGELEEWRRELFGMIAETQNLDWLLLTKRPENIEMLWPFAFPDNSNSWPNVWLGVTTENKEQANKRLPIILQIPAAVHFVSIEPMLGEIDFRKVPGFNIVGLDLSRWWVIVGGESGPNARPMNPEWVRQIRDQCKAAGVPFFFKQWGEWSYEPRLYGSNGEPFGHHNEYFRTRVGNHRAGCLLDGVEHKEFPKGKSK